MAERALPMPRFSSSSQICGPVDDVQKGRDMLKSAITGDQDCIERVRVRCKEQVQRIQTDPVCAHVVSQQAIGTGCCRVPRQYVNAQAEMLKGISEPRRFRSSLEAKEQLSLCQHRDGDGAGLTGLL